MTQKEVVLTIGLGEREFRSAAFDSGPAFQAKNCEAQRPRRVASLENRKLAPSGHFVCWCQHSKCRHRPNIVIMSKHRKFPTVLLYRPQECFWSATLNSQTGAPAA